MLKRFVSEENSNRIFFFLEAFRSALIHSGLIAIPFACAGYVFAGPTIAYLGRASGVTLAAFGLPEAFLAHLTLSLSFGVMVSLPYLQFKVFSVVPRIYPFVSARSIFLFWIASVVLFFSGALFCLLVPLQYGVKFLMSYQSETLRAVISVKKFVSFCLMFVFGFGLIFELPVVMILLGWIGLVNPDNLSRYRRYAILVISILSALLTPTPDIFNMMLMAVPLYLLFEIGLIGMRLARKRRTAHVGAPMGVKS